MESEWEEFTIPSATTGGLHVTVSEKGEILIGANTYTRMGKPDAVILMFDRKNGFVGLKPAHPRTPNAYPVVSATKGRHKLVRACRFWNFHGMRFERRTAFDSPKIENDVLVLNPATTYPVERRKRKNG